MVWALNWLHWPSTDNPKKFIDLGNSPGSCLQVCHVLDSSEKTRAHDVKNTYVCIYTKLHNYVCIHVYIYICTWYHIIYSYIIYILYIHMFVLYIYVYMYVYLFAASIMQVVLIYPSTWSPGHHHSSHWAVWDYIYICTNMYKCIDTCKQTGTYKQASKQTWTKVYIGCKPWRHFHISNAAFLGSTKMQV